MFGLILSMVNMALRLSRRVMTTAQRRRQLGRLKRVGKNFLFDSFSTIVTPQFIEIGDNVFIGEQAHISAELTIGDNVMFGPRPLILGGNHYFAVKGKSVRFLHPRNRENSAPINVEDEVWCGAGVMLLGGVTLGMGCVIGAGSVVSKSIPPYVVATGNYCKPIRRIFDDQTLFEHLVLLGCDESVASQIVERRNQELDILGLADLTSIDRTSTYWEVQEEGR